MSPVIKFMRGLTIPFNGFFIVITSFKLFLLAVIPFWIIIFASIFLFYSFWSQSYLLAPFLMKWLPGFYTFTEQIKVGQISLFSALFSSFMFIFLFFFIMYFSYIAFSIVGAPFYSLIADHVLTKKGVQPVFKNSFMRWLYTTLKMLIISLFKLVVFMGITILLFMISFWSFGIVFVPFIICLMIAFDCMDFSMECMNFSLRKRWHYMMNHFSLFLGLAFVIMAFSAIPGLFTLSLPFFIAGSADAFADNHLKGTYE